MKQHLEIEYKSILHRSSFEAFQRAWNFSDAKKQVNLYYDTKDNTLLNQKMMARIRLIDNTYEFTLKIPQTDGVLEHELVLDSLDLGQSESLTDLFSTLGVAVDQLQEVAQSTTYRQTFADLYGTWCLDHSVFDAHEDYEIEYELFDANALAYDHFLDTLKTMNVNYEKARPKYIRARFPDPSKF